MLLYNFTLKNALDLTANNYGIRNFRKTAIPYIGIAMIFVAWVI